MSEIEKYYNGEIHVDFEEDYKESYRREIDYWRIQYSNLQEEIERLNSIIKEVREYIVNNLWSDYGDRCDVSKKEIFQILDKENK